jgi:homoserine dehydrogenase
LSGRGLSVRGGGGIRHHFARAGGGYRAGIAGPAGGQGTEQAVMDTIRVGLFGLGVVGSGVLEILRRNRDLIRQRLGAELRVTRAVVAHPGKKRPVPLDGISVSSDPDSILRDPEIQIVAELMGGTELARRVVLGALDAGKPVVTANKALLAQHAQEVFGRAYAKGLPLGIEASVAGGIPVLRSLREGLAADHILEITGIVNGTCNYILTRMSDEGAPFAEVLAEAQRLGYAEADPSFDIGGFDAAQKLAVLVNLAYGATVHYPGLYVEGIEKVTPMDILYARQLGYAIKLLAIAKPRGEKVEARVHPTLIARTHLLASVSGVFNAVFLTGDNVDATLSYGRGAGGLPTGSAVVGDLIDVARGLLTRSPERVPPLSVQREHLRALPVMPIEEVLSEYYLRFQVQDRPGVLAGITKVMGERNISIQSMFQPSQADHPEDPVQVVLITHQAREKDVQDSLREIQPMPFVLGPTQMIRIETFQN